MLSPAFVHTIADQLATVRRTWKGYMRDYGNSTTGEPTTCRHPQLNSQDHTQTARVGDQYAARHNPFVYFQSIIDSLCDTNVVALTDLPPDLMFTRTTPNYVFITPNLCEDGHDAPCVDGRPGGLTSADLFLQEWVRRILASPAFRRDGLLIVAFDEGDISAAPGHSCCLSGTTVIADDSGLLIAGDVQIHPALSKSTDGACLPLSGMCVPIP